MIGWKAMLILINIYSGYDFEEVSKNWTLMLLISSNWSHGKLRVAMNHCSHVSFHDQKLWIWRECYSIFRHFLFIHRGQKGVSNLWLKLPGLWLGKRKGTVWNHHKFKTDRRCLALSLKNILELHWKARINVYRHKVCMISKSFKQTLNYHYVRVAGITYTFSQSCQFSTEYQIFGV